MSGCNTQGQEVRPRRAYRLLDVSEDLARREFNDIIEYRGFRDD